MAVLDHRRYHSESCETLGVSENGLDIDWMNQEKMNKAEMLIEKESEPVTPFKKSLSTSRMKYLKQQQN